GAAQDAPEYRALDTSFGHNANGQDAEQSDKQRHNSAPSGSTIIQVKRSHGHTGRSAGNYQLSVLQSYKSDKQANTGRNGSTNSVGNCIEDFFTQAGYCEQGENDAIHQNQYQSIGIAQSETETYRVDKIGIEAHAR